jgi:RNA polymerase sigma-70 factor (ECF subfamily)
MGLDDDATSRLIEGAVRGEEVSRGPLLERHRDRLRRMVALRLDPRLRGRVDPSDVIQEAFLEAVARLPEYARGPTMPFFLWLRLIAGQRLRIVHRRHLGVRARDAGREVPLGGGAFPEASSDALAARLADGGPGPSEIARRAEREERLRSAIEGLDPADREVLALRHFEQLTNAEAARVLGVSEAAAGQRHFRAVRRLKEALSRLPGGAEEILP